MVAIYEAQLTTKSTKTEAEREPQCVVSKHMHSKPMGGMPILNSCLRLKVKFKWLKTMIVNEIQIHVVETMFVTEGQIHVEHKTWWKTILKAEGQIHIEGKTCSRRQNSKSW